MGNNARSLDPYRVDHVHNTSDNSMATANPREFFAAHRSVLYLGGGLCLGVQGIESFAGDKLGIERAWDVPTDQGHDERLIDMLRWQEREHGKHLDVLMWGRNREPDSIDAVLCFTVHWERMEWLPLCLSATSSDVAKERVMLHGVRYEEDDERKAELTAALRLERG